MTAVTKQMSPLVNLVLCQISDMRGAPENLIEDGFQFNGLQLQM
jgi:hypothetical protein